MLPLYFVKNGDVDETEHAHLTRKAGYTKAIAQTGLFEETHHSNDRLL